MIDRVLRDHSGECVHGVQMYCGNVIAETGERCPGGREVTIDYEAFRREFWGTQIPNREYEERAQRALIAALGGSGG